MFKPLAAKLLASAVTAAVLAGCNVETASQFVTVDEQGNINAHPVLMLRGEANLEVLKGAAFVDPGVSAVDFEDGEISAGIISDAELVDTAVTGLYKITYNVSDSQGAAATPIVRTVMVVDPTTPDTEPGEEAVTVPGITSIELVNFTAQGEIGKRTALDHNGVIVLSEQSTDRINLVALSEDESRTGSVHFALEGPVSIDRIENNAIYTLANETENLSISGNALPVGDYTLFVTPYDSTDGEGVPGQTLTLNFRVLAEPAAVVTDPPVVDHAVPPIVSFKLVSQAPGSRTLVDVAELKHGDVIDVRTLPASPINVVAVSEDVSATGSVHFDLQGPQSLDRYENNAVYTLAVEGEGLNASGAAAAGDYTLTATPYSGADMGGVAGTPVTLSFTLAHTETVADVPVEDENVDEDTVDDAETPVTTVPEVTPPVLDEDFTPRPAGEGFTAIKPSADTKRIYVSSAQGKDTNDCLSASTPCKSLRAGTEKMRSGQPDHLYLKAGDSWRGEALAGVQSGRSAAEPAVVAFYGNGKRPLIETHGKALSYNNAALKNVNFIGLHFKAYKLDPKHPAFTGAHGDGDKASFLGAHTNLLIEDCVFDHMEIVIQDWNGKPQNFTLRRNIFTGAYYNQSSNNRNIRPSNLFVKGINGLLIEQNVFDHGGWNPNVKGAGANMYNHNLYIQYENVGNSITVRDNIITRASSHGVHGRPGGLYENNFFGRNAISLQMGYKDHPLPKGTFAKAIGNVITEGESMVKGQAPCVGNNLCTPALWALHTADIGQGTVLVKDNVIHSQSPKTQWRSLYSNLKAFGLGLAKSNLATESNNLVWHWVDGSEGSNAGYPAPGRTLGDYHAQLSKAGTLNTLKNTGYVNTVRNGTDGFDSFMNLVLDRQLQKWDDNLSADAINDYIRAGFNR